MMRFDDPLTPAHPTRPVAAQATTVAAMFAARVRRTPDGPAFRYKQDGRWLSATWEAFDAAARSLASFLIEAGVEAGDKVTIIGATRAEWAVADIGGQLAGAVTVGAYPTLTAEQLAYIVDHSDSKVAFVQGRAEVDKLLEARESCPRLQTIVVWDADDAAEHIADHEHIIAWADVVAATPDHAAVARRMAAIDGSACAVIVYTSGTTGPPKGAMISHANILCVLSHDTGVQFDAHDHALSFLPMAHVAERILGFYGRVNHGTSTSFATSIPAVLTEVREVKPTLFGSVPRIFEKAYDRVRAEVDKAPAAKSRVFGWAESVGRRCVERWQRGLGTPRHLAVQYALADRLVFRKLREVFGGRVKFFVTGAAPIPREVLDFFWASGFRVFEAYGITEGTVISHINRPGATRLGSVGKPLGYAECKLAEDGEILVRGGHVFLGYYKNEAATAETVDAEGWLHTGDIGRIDDDGYLFIVDRKKHIIITAGGKNLTPANIENEIKTEDPLISQVHAHGDRRPYITALVTVSPMWR
ncbi:MAG: long-chain fatty acid--CoA ligase [Myxococcota bacterium]